MANVGNDSNAESLSWRGKVTQLPQASVKQVGLDGIINHTTGVQHCPQHTFISKEEEEKVFLQTHLMLMFTVGLLDNW